MPNRRANRLVLFGRPKAIFDPTNKRDRTAYLDFLETGSWRNCPVNYIIDDDSISATYCIEKKLLAYYLRKEFGEDRFPKLLYRFDEQFDNLL